MKTTTLALMILMMVFAFNTKATAQVQANALVENAVANTDSKMELVSWLMATKQAGSTNSYEVTATKQTSKKQFINSGMQTNRLLNKTLLKKAVTRDVAVA